MPENLWPIKIVALIMLLIVSFVVSGSEVAYFSEYSPSNLAVRRTFGLLVSILIFNNLANSFLSGLTSEILPLPGIEISIILTFIITFLGEIIPKRLALTYPKFFVKPTRWIYEFTSALVSMFKINLYKNNPKLAKYALIDSIADILYYSDISEDERTILAKLVYAIHSKGYAIIVPTSIMPVLKAETSVCEAKMTIRRYKYRFFPVYFFRRDEVIGFVKREDILSANNDDPLMDLPMLRPHFKPILSRISEIIKEIEEKGIIALVDEYGTIRGFACKSSLENWIIHQDNILPLNISLMEVFLLTGREVGPMHWDLADLFQYKLGRNVLEGDSIVVSGLTFKYEDNVVFVIQN